MLRVCYPNVQISQNLREATQNPYHNSATPLPRTCLQGLGKGSTQSSGVLRRLG